ncbi:MAG: carbohydrate ABC transporter permease [Actinomycetota bacterium]|nr:carbohydrate ABC transporter permease [Actinomycetota bacterium]
MTMTDLERPSKKRGATGAERLTSRTSIISMAFLFVMATYFLVPVYWLVISSTKGPTTLYGSQGFWFSNFQFFSNLSGLFGYSNGIFVRWILNTVLYAGVGATVATLIASLAGYALSKYNFVGKEAIFSIILGGVLVPGTALALPLYLLMSKVHLTDTYWSVLLPAFVSPFGVFLSRVYAGASIPDELIDAGRIDGAGEFKIFRSIGLKIMSPALVTIFLFQFVAIWNNFFLPLVMLSNQNLYPVTLGLYSWDNQYGQAPQLIAYVVIGALISVIPLIIAFLSLQRFWQTGLTSGSVKA